MTCDHAGSFTNPAWQLARWHEDRARQAEQHPSDAELAMRGRSRGEHYRRKNTSIAYRTFVYYFRPFRSFDGMAL